MPPADSIKMDCFRTNVRSFLHLRHLTQVAMADRAGLSQEWLSKMLAGRSNPTLPICERIARALDTSLEALLAEPPGNVSDSGKNALDS